MPLEEFVRTNACKSMKDGAKSKKRHNILVFSKLEREGLSFMDIERRIRIHTTRNGENIYIQYPGKESARQNDKVRPWDFRPKVETRGGQLCQDLSFKDVWNDIIDISDADKEILPVLAAVLYRMAHMVDHVLVTEEYRFGDFDVEKDDITYDSTLSFSHYKYSPNPEVIDVLQERIGDIRGLSIEAYLFLNDYLAQNEDCKYFYRDEVVNGKAWRGDIGRTNNLMTHIMIIAFLRKMVRFTDVMDQFQRMRGVAPLPEKLLSEVTNGLVCKESDRYHTMRLDQVGL